MKIVIDKPPIYDAIVANGMHPHARTIFTYGDTIYNPGNVDIVDHLIEHEQTHYDQQMRPLAPQDRTTSHMADAADAWWGRYLIDPYFRIEQEVEAYANQYAYICATVRDRNRRHKILWDLATSLSGPMYGSVISHFDAMHMIKTKAKI